LLTLVTAVLIYQKVPKVSLPLDLAAFSCYFFLGWISRVVFSPKADFGQHRQVGIEIFLVVACYTNWK